MKTSYSLLAGWGLIQNDYKLQKSVLKKFRRNTTGCDSFCTQFTSPYCKLSVNKQLARIRTKYLWSRLSLFHIKGFLLENNVGTSWGWELPSSYQALVLVWLDWSGLAWLGLAWCGMGMVGYDFAWFGMGWTGLVWFGMRVKLNYQVSLLSLGVGEGSPN